MVTVYFADPNFISTPTYFHLIADDAVLRALYRGNESAGACGDQDVARLHAQIVSFHIILSYKKVSSYRKSRTVIKGTHANYRVMG